MSKETDYKRLYKKARKVIEEMNTILASKNTLIKTQADIIRKLRKTDE